MTYRNGASEAPVAIHFKANAHDELTEGDPEGREPTQCEPNPVSCKTPEEPTNDDFRLDQRDQPLSLPHVNVGNGEGIELASTLQPTEGKDIEKAVSKEILIDVPYSTFSTGEKKVIILAASVATFISPLTSNIYFPALNTLAADLHVSVSKINLSITTYMIFQGVAPTFIGGLADSAGRRPAYMAGFTIYIAANIALALQTSYPALMVLRSIQSAGSSGMGTIATGIIADCITSAERGQYIGFTAVSTVLGPSVSPILGGGFSQTLGWRSIFWFLTIFGAVLFALNLAFFPETCRNVVGDGSVPPPKWNRSLLNHIHERRMRREGMTPNFAERDGLAKSRRIRFPNPMSSIKVLARKEQLLLLSYAGIVYASYSAIAATITTQLRAIYGLNDLKLGLCFIPISIGSTLAMITNGKYDPVDRNYARHAKQLGMPLVKNRRQDLTNFPIERARIEIALPLIYGGCLFTIIYGWLLQAETNLAGPLIMLTFIGFAISATFKVISILNIDLAEGRPATVSAAFSLIRCLLGAGAVAVIDLILKAMGRGWTFTFIGLLQIALSPMLLAIVKWGPAWRKENAEKEQRMEMEGNEQREMKHNHESHS
ncbi:MAG: hypothetical protein Q9160_006220 [Pyrenula sp. 1 TL-2023]